MKKIMLLLLILLTLPVIYAAPLISGIGQSTIFQYYFTNGSNTFTDRNGNVFNIPLTNTLQVVWESISGTDSQQSAVVIKVNCQSLNNYKLTGYDLISNYIVINKKTKIGTNNYSDDYTIYQASTSEPQIFNSLYILQPRQIVSVSQYLRFNGRVDLNQENYPCNIQVIHPSYTNNDLKDSGLYMEEIQRNQAIQIRASRELISEQIQNIIDIIYEIFLIAYWIIKILVAVSVLGMIFWVFIFFYQLIKKLLGD